MGVYWKGIPQNLLHVSVRILGINALAVETGTYLGNTTELLARHFGQCTSIERDPKLAQRATDRLRKLSNIKIECGTSRDLLPAAIPEGKSPAFFWLDAHYSAGLTAGVDDPCPLVQEVDFIVSRRVADNTIVLIDDARGLTGLNGWPSLGQVCRQFTSCGWEVVCLDDVLIASAELHIQEILTQCWKSSRIQRKENLNKYRQFLNVKQIFKIMRLRLNW